MANEMVNGKPNEADAAATRRSPFAEAFGKLSARERTMIIALLAIGVICALYFFVVTPSFDRLSALELEAEEAETEQTEHSQVISQGIGAEEQIAEAIAAYDGIKGQFFDPLMIEQVDSTVTGYLVKAGFDPQSLSVSTLEPETLVSFTPQDNGDGAAVESTGEEPAAEPVAEDGSGGEAAQTGGSLHSYTVNVTAGGGWSNLYKLLSRLGKLNGAELTQYSFSGAGADSGKGSFSMVIKLYVFIEEAYTPALAEGKTPTEAVEAPAE
jgi:hypothetical protein